MVKLLSTFSGWQFCRGHASMHFALFVGSYIVTTKFSVENDNYNDPHGA